MLQKWMKKFLWTLFHLENFQFSSLLGLVRSSPFLPRVASTLRQKMDAFQTLMDEEESDAAQDGDGEGCIRTRDDLSDGSSDDVDKENNPPVTPTPSKRRRLGPSEGCGEEIRAAGAPILRSSLKAQEVKEERVTPDVTGVLPSGGAADESHCVLIPQTNSPSRRCQDEAFEVQSPSRPPPVGPAAAAACPPRPSPPFHVPSFPSPLEMKPADDDGTSAVKKKKKQVRFGGPLSPEFFDKHLPPSTPLQKGGTPAHAATPGGSFQLRSLLKTPQRSSSDTPQSQPDLSSLAEFGASPTFSIPRRHTEGSQIVLPSSEEDDCDVTSDPECVWDPQPLNLDNAFHNESLSQTETAFIIPAGFSFESDLQASETCRVNAGDEPGSFPETNERREAAAEDPPPAKCNRRQKAGPEPAAAPTRSGSRKRKQPEESQPAKKSTRSAAKSASGKMKMAAGEARRWRKDVDRSLYGSRDYASKEPELSPIWESQSPAAPQTPPPDLAAVNDEARQNLEAESDPAAVVTATRPGEGTAARTNRRLSGPRARGRPPKKTPKKRTIRVPEANSPSDEKESCEAQTASVLGTQSERDGLTTEPISCSSRDAEPDPAAAPHGASPGGEPASTEPVQKKGGGRRGHGLPPPLEQQNQENVPPGAAGQEEQRQRDEALAPWQTDFNFEDVFKPVATRGQRSVRRSLRLRSLTLHGDDGAGLAWMAHTSPAAEPRRRTRGRRLSAALPVQAALPEETQESS